MIYGKPMIQRVYEQASKANFKEVIVATDDQRIEEAVRSFGGSVVMTADYHTTGTERCAEAYSLSDQRADVIVNIQGDEPMVNPDHLNQLITSFQDESLDVATMISPMPSDQASDPNTVKVAMRSDGRVLYFSRSPIPFYRNANTEQSYVKHLGVYAYRVSVLPELVQLTPSDLELAENLEQLRWLENGYTIHAVEVNDNGISVDTPEDLNRLLAILKESMG